MLTDQQLTEAVISIIYGIIHGEVQRFQKPEDWHVIFRPGTVEVLSSAQMIVVNACKEQLAHLELTEEQKNSLSNDVIARLVNMSLFMFGMHGKDFTLEQFRKEFAPAMHMAMQHLPSAPPSSPQPSTPPPEDTTPPDTSQSKRARRSST